MGGDPRVLAVDLCHVLCRGTEGGAAIPITAIVQQSVLWKGKLTTFEKLQRREIILATALQTRFTEKLSTKWLSKGTTNSRVSATRRAAHSEADEWTCVKRYLSGNVTNQALREFEVKSQCGAETLPLLLLLRHKCNKPRIVSQFVQLGVTTQKADN
jgi:hypothetical protein